MKKFILLALIAVAGAFSANAQVKFGVTAGLNVSSWTGDVEDAKYKAGFQVGAVADYAITPNFSIVPELLFTQKGVKVEKGGATGTVNLNYLQLPINAAYKFDLGLAGKLSVFAGPYIGYGLSSSTKVEEDGVSVTLSGDDNPYKFGSKDEEVNPLDFGLNIGVGYQYTNYFFKAQYNLGLSNLSNEDDFSVKNSNIAVTVGYMF